MSDFIYFILGTTLGGMFGVACMCVLQINRLSEGKEDADAEKKRTDIKTEYAKELSELLPLINFWLMPSVFPATEEELHHKYQFVMEVLDHMGLPLFDDEIVSFTKKFINDISETPCGHTSMPENAGKIKEKGGNEP